MRLKDLKLDKWGRKGLTLVTLLVVTAGVLYAWANHSKIDVLTTSPYTERSADSTEFGEKNFKNCAGVNVSSVLVSTEYLSGAVPTDRSPTISIGPRASGKPITITIFGPLLGSMDSRKVKTDVACTAKGFAVTAIVTRSADYQGALAKNVLWRPKIDIAVVLREPEVDLEGTWKMRLTTGVELEHAETPPYPEQRYPITLTKTIR